MPMQGRRIEVRGTVQGVGFRPFVHRIAQRLAILGHVRNDSAGVIIDAHGNVDALDDFVAALQLEQPPAARVQSVDWVCVDYKPYESFTIDVSAPSGELRVSIPADLATCDDCLAEINNPANRRYRYPFTNCTNCGPRYSIVISSPYDRAMTSMARFPMCEECQREYDDPADRRFHAQPNACAKCGPRLTAFSAQKSEILTPDPIEFAGRALRAGLIVAVKGIGGFHLACNAASPQAVKRLRERKRRDAKPFAVMVRDLAQAEELALLNDEERRLLTSVERPIVLAKSRILSPDNDLIGLFLPYTPLHHLLLASAGIPLVMTSGNISDEPMVTTNEAALHDLHEIADVFIMHDRDIVTRVDDSIVRVIDGAPAILRRARGWVPRAIETQTEFAEPVLACGAHLKNTFCLTSGKSAFLGPHIGDLETVDTLKAYEAAIERMKEFIGVQPKVVAHDMHPDYFSTRFALAQEGVETIAVQHHHAHIASAMAEHGLEGPVIGIAYDGTGYGTDGTLWGGETLIATYSGFERFATFRPLPLAGGEQAIRQPWRIALAILDDAYEGCPPLHAIPLFREIERPAVEAVRRMISRNFNAPLARGVGRYFDAFASLILGLPGSHYEGELAFRWNVAADASETGVYPVVLREGVSPWEIDIRPAVRDAVDDLRSGVKASTISARFHNTIASATFEVATAALAAHGNIPIVLSGGCFQNARLAESVIDALRPVARVYMNRRVPTGDGGIALGQAFVANAIVNARNAVTTKGETVCV